MPVAMPAPQVLEREFLSMRAKILELAASFDRLDRGEGEVGDDPRVARLYEALDVLKSPRDDRAEQVQLLFSRRYEDDWRKQFGL